MATRSAAVVASVEGSGWDVLSEAIPNQMTASGCGAYGRGSRKLGAPSQGRRHDHPF